MCPPLEGPPLVRLPPRLLPHLPLPMELPLPPRAPPLPPPHLPPHLLLLLLPLLFLVFVLACRLARHPRPLHLVLRQQKGSLDVFGPARLRTPLEAVAVRRGLLPPATCEAALRDLRGDAVDWQTHRHEVSPTVDAELCDALPWLDDVLAASLPGLLGDLGHIYGVDPSTLWLREAFCVKYDASTTGHKQRLSFGRQAGLETHRDSSVFSFVIPLTDATKDHCGGGTTFDGRRGPGLVPGDCLLFCGRRLHGAEPVRRGQRYVVAGFVDLRVGLLDLRRLSRQLHLLDPRASCSSCRCVPPVTARTHLDVIGSQPPAPPTPLPAGSFRGPTSSRRSASSSGARAGAGAPSWRAWRRGACICPGWTSNRSRRAAPRTLRATAGLWTRRPVASWPALSALVERTRVERPLLPRRSPAPSAELRSAIEEDD